MKTSGIINVYKKKGYTSFDVVAILRKTFHIKKIGHTGTLDPEAEGVLPICFGKATKVCDLFTEKDKVYQAVLRLGVETDTEDMTGNVLEERPVICSEEEVRSAIASFVGEIMQVPPMYSALKVQGKKLYELARAGEEVERQARPIRIYEIVIDKMELPRVTFTVKCSKGTYIRTLCKDIGEALGCGGCMESLLRKQVGMFSLDEALTIEEIKAKFEEDTLDEVIKPIDDVFDHTPKVYLRPEAEKYACNGVPLEPHNVDFIQAEDGKCDFHQLTNTLVRVYLQDGTFVGAYEYQNQRLKLRKMFYEK